MVYKGKEYFVAANTRSLNRTAEYSQTEANNMCVNKGAQIVARPENDNRTKAILAFLQPIATKVGNHLHVWAAPSASPIRYGVYVVDQTDPSNAHFREEQRGNTHAFLALCERGESSINTTCTLEPSDRTLIKVRYNQVARAVVCPARMGELHMFLDFA